MHAGYTSCHTAGVGMKDTKMIFKMNWITGLERCFSHQGLGSLSNCQGEYDI